MLHALYTFNNKPTTRPEERVPVPEPYILCEDVTVIGTPFYVMEFVDGRIFTDPRMPESSPEDRREWCVFVLSQQHLPLLMSSHLQLAWCRTSAG